MNASTTEIRPEFKALNLIRSIGRMNMFDAANVIQEVYGYSRAQSIDIVREWMQWVEADPTRVNNNAGEQQ